ncbi:MAG TPA: response regulator transcription factor [Thermoanaerobaculia bacterium]|jgi:DNA-binding response OmpR family regulator
MGSTKGRVLVVDDEPAIRALVAKILQRAGYPVDTARDGAEAIEKLNQEEAKYAVLVLDLMMPNIDGYGLIEYLKERGGPRPAIIVVSAGDSAAFRQLDGAIVHSILRKPFDIDVLGDLVDAAAQSLQEEEERENRLKSAEVVPFRRNDNKSG